MIKKLLLCIGLLSWVGLLGPEGAFSQEAWTLKDYSIHPSDVLEISVYGEAELTRKLVVRPDGKISFPLIGDVKVAGHSTEQVREVLNEKISTFIPDVSSTVIVEQLASLKYSVLGEVASPGMFTVSSQMTVLQALSLAGGLNTFADENSIRIIRGYGKYTKAISFDYSQVKRGKHLEQNILLQRGDVVLVP